MTDKYYVGITIAGNQVQDLMVYPKLDCTRDTLQESVDRYLEKEDEYVLQKGIGNNPDPLPPIEQAVIYEVDLDGSAKLVEELGL